MDLPSHPVIVLTREPEDNRELSRELIDKGVDVFEIPCLATRNILPKTLPSSPFSAVVFTSRRGVRGVAQQPAVSTWMSRCLTTVPPPLVAAVGKATATALEAIGFSASLVANPPRGDVLANLLLKNIPSCSSVVVVKGDLGAGELIQMLESACRKVTTLTVYENVEPPVPRFSPFPVAGIFIASPSAANRLLKKNKWMAAVPFYTLGHTTTRSLKELGAKSVNDMGIEKKHWIQSLTDAYHQSRNQEDT